MHARHAARPAPVVPPLSSMALPVAAGSAVAIGLIVLLGGRQFSPDLALVILAIPALMALAVVLAAQAIARR